MANYEINLDILFPSKRNRDRRISAIEVMLLQSDLNIEKVQVTGNGNILSVDYDPGLISQDQLKAHLQLLKIKTGNHYRQESLQISGMDCSDCAKVIEHALLRQNGVLVARVSYVSERLHLEYDGQKINLKSIQKLAKQLGYQLTVKEQPKTWWQANHELILSLCSGVLLLLSWLVGKYGVTVISYLAETFSVNVVAWPLAKYSATASLVLALSAFATAGFLTIRHSIHTLLQSRFDIDVLMVFAAFGAGALGAWSEGALLLFLFSLGHALEHRAMARARNAVKALANLAPTTAMVFRDGIEQEIAVQDLHLNDQVLVRPGQRLPIDGEVVDGASAVDQAPITGESIPVEKQAGDEVFSGTVNGEGLLTVAVKKLAKDTTLNRMVKLVLEADTQKSPAQNFTDTFVKYFVPVVLIGVLLLIFVPPMLGEEWRPALYRAMSVLVAASPCALAIATPAAILSGVARAAQKGILIKGGMHLENLGMVQAIAFDKTGTLTQGKSEVHEIIGIGADGDQVLAIAASIEKLSTHPLALAVVDAAQQKALPVYEVTQMQSRTGLGLTGQLNGLKLEVGSLKLFTQVPENVAQAIDDLLGAGQTVMVVKHGEKWLGLIGVQDTVRPEAKATLQHLLDQGIKKTIMLTGDNERVAQAIAKEAGITEVKANLLPEDKLSAITELEKENQIIAMVGDGVNDAPAMARATVGIAMGGAGTDVALEASDIALMADDLSKLPFAVQLSRAARRIILQNLCLSLTIVLILIISTLTGMASMSLAVVIHEGSTLVVVANALRLLRHKELNVTA